MSKQSASAVEGRAIAARPSLRLLAAFAMALAVALTAPVAQAKPDRLKLNETVPKSTLAAPALSTTPLVRGEVTGFDTSAVLFGRGGAGPIAAAENPANVVTIYVDPTCSGEVVGQGNVGDLKGPGIPVEIENEDAETVLYAAQSEEGDPEPSDCSDGLSYWHSSTAPPPGEDPPTDPGDPGGSGKGSPPSGGVSAPPQAPRLRTVPGGRANDNTPRVTGSAPGATGVRIFAGADCKGTPVAKGTPEQLAAGIEIEVVNDTTTILSGLSVGGGGESVCSEPIAYVEDSTAPQTRITMGPGAKTRRRSAIFRFTDTTDNAPGTAYFCKVDRRKWKPCGSPLRLKKLSLKRHTLRVKATDPAGNAEARGAKRSFKVVRRP